MFDFFDKILGFIETVFNFFLNLIESLFQAILFLGQGSTFVLSLAPMMPTIISTCIIIVVSISIVKFIIGR